MRRIVLLLLLVVLLGGQARAAELPGALTESLPEAAGDVAGTNFQQGISSLLDTVRESLFSLLRQGMSGVVRLLMVLLLCGVGESLLQPLQEKNAFHYVTLAGTAAIVTVAAGDLSTLMGLGVETITQLEQFSKALLPTLAAATASAGMVGTASMKQVVTVFFCDVLITMINGLILPFLSLYIGAAAAGIICLIVHLVTGALTGTAAVLVSIWLACGLILTALGLVGEYIGKIYGEVKDRPRYIIEAVTLYPGSEPETKNQRSVV